ncbi:MAG TPA: DUF4123 domain-containing protein [Panacibacter sp.]|nr:DUF4123 domain-containing protein [Panacibacter sp.]
MVSGNYILLDSARMNEEMDNAKLLNPNFELLYKTKGNDLLQTVAPYLYTFSDGNDFSDYFFENGWGGSWGIFIFTSSDFKELHKHLRRFLTVRTEDGVELYFRFYDPRVLRIFLPTCDTKQLFEFFGPVHFFLMEDQDPNFGVKFWLENGLLKSKQIPLHEIYPGNQVIENTKKPIPSENENKIILNFQRNQSVSNRNVDTQEQMISKPSKPKWNMFD